MQGQECDRLVSKKVNLKAKNGSLVLQLDVVFSLVWIRCNKSLLIGGLVSVPTVLGIDDTVP